MRTVDDVIKFVANNPNCTRFEMSVELGRFVYDIMDIFTGYALYSGMEDFDHSNSKPKYFEAKFSSRNPDSEKNTFTLTKLGLRRYEDLINQK